MTIRNVARRLVGALGSARLPQESGQSIVIIALIFVGLLAAVGLSVDVGFAFVRSSQFSRALDSAALAGVVDLPAGTDDTAPADVRAAQFLAANGWYTETMLGPPQTARGRDEQGFPVYLITGTWPVETYFMSVLGIGPFPITHRAGAAYHAQANVFVPTTQTSGHIREATQFIVGQEGCTILGDPVSPQWDGPGDPNEDYSRYGGFYRYRILIPDNYTATNQVTVELFDTDSSNRFDPGKQATYTKAGGGGDTFNLPNCPTNNVAASCVMETGKDAGSLESLESVFENPFWFRRVDDNTTSACTLDSGNDTNGMVTTFELYYIDGNGERQTLGEYQDDNSNLAETDLKWVTPCDGCPVPTQDSGGNFNVTVSTLPVVGNNRIMYLDVAASGGAAKNVWDIWAHPDFTELGLPIPPSQVNERNLFLANNAGSYYNFGIEVYALGRMPLQHYWTGEHKLDLTPIEIGLGAGAAYISMFDFDEHTWNDGDLVATFNVDTLSTGVFNIEGLIVSANPEPDPPADSIYREATCARNGGLDCDGDWLLPQYAMGLTDDSFAGGTLQATYVANRAAMTWSVSVTDGRPFLVR